MEYQPKQNEQRQPYGSPELMAQKKKQFPQKNIHYAHHDTVLPSREFLKQLDKLNQSRVEACYALNPETNHFATEYKRTYQLGRADFEASRRYMEAGEYAGKNTFKEQLVNEASPVPERMRKFESSFDNRYQGYPSSSTNVYNDEETMSGSIRQTQRRQSPVSTQRFNQSILKEVAQSTLKPLTYQSEIKEDFNKQNRDLNQSIDNTYLERNQIPSEYDRPEQQLPRMEYTLPQINKYSQEPTVSNKSEGGISKINIKDFQQQEKTNYQSYSPVKHRNVLDRHEQSGGFVPSEQQRYFARLKNSVERQGARYQQHLSSVFVPGKLRDLSKIVEPTLQHKQLLEHLVAKNELRSSNGFGDLNKSTEMRSTPARLRNMNNLPSINDQSYARQAYNRSSMGGVLKQAVL